MPHEHIRTHPQGEGVKLIATPKELVELLIHGPNERKEAIEEIDNQGPKHKQVFSAVLLNRLNRLVHTIEKSTGTKFELQQGYELIREHGDTTKVLSVAVPILDGTDLEKKQIADAISHAPEHEALVYAMCLQVVEWAIKATGKPLDPKSR